MAFKLFTDLFNKIDNITLSFVNNTSNQTIVAIAPIVTVGLTLSFIIYGWLIIRGSIQIPIIDFMNKIIKISIITSIALEGGFYQTQIADAISRTPDELIDALVKDSTKKNGAATSIDEAADKDFSLAGKAFEHSGFFVENGIVYAMIGIVILITTSIFVALGGSILILTKLILAILAGIGPVFILSLLWQPTARFFEMWVIQIVNYMLLGLLTTMIFGLMLTIYSNYMGDMKFDGVQNIASALGGSVVLSFAMIIILLQVPNLASALAGGISLSYLQELKMIKGASQSISDKKANIQNRYTSQKPTSSDKNQQSNYSSSKENKFKGYYKGNSGKKSHENS